MKAWQREWRIEGGVSRHGNGTGRPCPQWRCRSGRLRPSMPAASASCAGTSPCRGRKSARFRQRSGGAEPRRLWPRFCCVRNTGEKGDIAMAYEHDRITGHRMDPRRPHREGSEGSGGVLLVLGGLSLPSYLPCSCLVVAANSPRSQTSPLCPPSRRPRHRPRPKPQPRPSPRPCCPRQSSLRRRPSTDGRQTMTDPNPMAGERVRSPACLLSKALPC